MTTLAFNHEEIAPRALKPSLLELDGISRESVEAHYKLYEGYVAKRNEILAKLGEVDLESANQVYSEIRALKVDLTFALGGIKNHELYFDHLGGAGGDPDGPIGTLIRRDSGRSTTGAPISRPREWRAAAGPGPPTTGMRGGSSTTSATPRTRSRSGTRRRSSRSTSTSTRTPRLPHRPRVLHRRLFDNLDWAVVNGWIDSYGIQP